MKEEESVTDISFLINNQSNQGCTSDFPFLDPAIVNTTDFPEQEEIEGVSLVIKKYIYVPFCFLLPLRILQSSAPFETKCQPLPLLGPSFAIKSSQRPRAQEALSQPIHRRRERRNARMGPSGPFAGPINGHLGRLRPCHPP